MEKIIIGRNNAIDERAYVGGEPQIYTRPLGETGGIRIGDNNIIREFVTIHKAEKSGSFTEIGDNNVFMVASHVAHDVKVGSNCIFVNGATMGGYAIIGDFVYMSAFACVRQNTRVGKCVFIGSHATITKDVPDYAYVVWHNEIRGVNKKGMERAGYSPEEILEVCKEYEKKCIITAAVESKY